MARTNVISREAAELQWDKFADFYDIDPEFVPVDHAVVFELQKQHFVKAVMRGRVEVLDGADGVVIKQNLNGGRALTYGVLGATAKAEMDKGDGRTQKIQYLLASLSGETFVSFTKITGTDWSTCEVVGTLFSNA
jgi:hypothetical protein